MKFEKITIPPGWQESFTKYPNGRTIFEALTDTITSVNEGIDAVNTKVDQGLLAIDAAADTIRSEVNSSFLILQNKLEQDLEYLQDDLVADIAVMQSQVNAAVASVADKVTQSQLAAVNAQLAEKVQNFKLKNVVVNGNFSQNIPWINGQSAKNTTSSGFLLLEEIALTNGVFCYSPVIQLQENDFVYARALAKGENIISYRLYLRGGITSTITLVERNSTIEFNSVSGVAKVVGKTGNINVGFSFVGLIGTENKKAYLDNICIINLTSTFGTGNEPTKLEMDELIKVIPNQWWDGELSLTQKQFITWQLNLIRKNTNAIIALGGTIV